MKIISYESFKEKNKDIAIPPSHEVNTVYANVPEWLRRWCYEKEKNTDGVVSTLLDCLVDQGVIGLGERERIYNDYKKKGS